MTQPKCRGRNGGDRHSVSSRVDSAVRGPRCAQRDKRTNVTPELIWAPVPRGPRSVPQAVGIAVCDRSTSQQFGDPPPLLVAFPGEA